MAPLSPMHPTHTVCNSSATNNRLVLPAQKQNCRRRASPEQGRQHKSTHRNGQWH